MITASMTVKRYEGQTSRQRISILSEPALGHHAMLGINGNGIDIACHMDVADLETLRARIDEVLAGLDAYREAA